MASKRFPIGFHIGPGGNRNGLREDFLDPLDRAGIAWFIMSGDDYPGDAADIAKNSAAPHTVCFRLTGKGKGQEVGYDFDVPNYNLGPENAANEHYDMTIKHLPPEFDRETVWLANINEVDKNRSDWLGWFCVQWAKRAMADGIKSDHLNWSSGEPEKGHWLELGMVAFLRLAAQNPDKIAVGLHEYSYTVDNIQDRYPYLIGRYQFLHEVVDGLGIERPTILITEWGWEYQNVPSVDRALLDIDTIAQLYVKEANIWGGATWYLGPGFGKIADQAQKLIKPVGDLALSWQHYIDIPDEPKPPPGGTMLRNPSFEGGTYKWNGVNEVNMPNEWNFWHADESVRNPIDGNPWSKFVRPEVVVPGKSNLPESERDLFVLDGSYTLKVFKGDGSIYFKMWQEIDLPEAGEYVLDLPIFADLVKGYTDDGKKVWADDPAGNDGLVRVIANGAQGDFISLSPGKWNFINHIHKATLPEELTVGIEVMLPFALANNGIFADDWLVSIDNMEPPDMNCIETDKNTRIHVLRPRSMNATQWTYVKGLTEKGLDIPGIGHVVVGYEGWTHTDSMDAIKKAVANGFTDSRLIIVDGHFIGTGLDESWMEANCPALVPYTIWLRSDGGQSGPFEFKAWPTNYKFVTQTWGANPDYYKQFGLPGHEGVDIRGPEGTPIYAVADGTVYRAEANPSSSNYGIHVRIRHQDSYQTIYAHGSRIPSGISVNSAIKAGDIIMYSGDTGNSSGAHLHLGLKREGYTYTDKYGTWPYFFRDPTPHLSKLCPACFASEPAPPATGAARLGLHASADPGLAAGEASMFAQAKIELAKIMSIYPEEHVSELASKLAGVPFVIRAYLSFHNRPAVTPQQFFDWTVNDVGRYMKYLQGREVFIELHNEPNLRDEGWMHSWGSGAEFANWLLPVIQKYKQAIPGAKMVFPGLSPGGDVAGIRYDSMRFVNEARAAVNACDVLGVHAYWASNWPMNLALQTVDGYRNAFPGKPIIITEASNNRGDTPQAAKGNEYIQFWQHLRNRKEVYGVTYFVASASNPTWNWGTGTGETWLGTSIPGIVGAR